MAHARVLPVALFIFLLLVVVHGQTVGTMWSTADQVAPARTCESHSIKFKGPCFNHANCRSICQGEGFDDGECRGFRHRCICQKPC